MAGEDFVHVKLSASGEKFGNGGPVRIVSGTGQMMTFSPGATVRVTRNVDWGMVLVTMHFEGKPMFELAPETAPPAPTAPNEAN